MTILETKNNQLTTYYLNTTIHEKNLNVISDVLLENSINHTAFGTSIGSHKIIADFNIWFSIFSDIKFKICNTILMNDTVIHHLVEQAQHVGYFKSIPPSGKIITFDASITFRANGHKITGYSLSTNLEAILKQITNETEHNIYELMKKPIIANSEHVFFEKIRDYLNSINIHLTIQQIKCLSLWFFKKTAKEIAKLLDISHRTVEVYLDAIKLKLQLHNKQAVIEFIKAKHLQHLMKECADILTGEMGF